MRRTLDIHVFWVAFSGVLITTAVDHTERQMKAQSYKCQESLSDGRPLMTTWLGPNGHARCTYTSPPFVDKRKKKA